MDEELSVKAPVTRLRRRMSVEAEDSPLPTTPSTPTKKRATRLAAKPQLELIDEVAAENVLKRTTRKAAVKENVEADTNTGTPTPVTPSRRSTRIRSNTSILAETTTQNIESPRAKRALRRTSQLGSDTESAAVTPARQTRRTRKDSNTNVDKPAGTGDENVVVPSTNAEANTENPEKITKDTKENETDNHSPSTRKSPRLQNKNGGDVETYNANKETDKSPKNSVNINKSSKDSTPVKSNHIEIHENKSIQSEIYENNDNKSPIVNKPKEEKLMRIDLVDVIKTRDTKSNALNKSTSAIEKISNDLKNKRNRTKSWTTLSSTPSNNGITSDNDDAKENTNRSKKPYNDITGSGDGSTTSNEKICGDEPDMKSPNRLNKSKSSSLNIIEKETEVSHEKILELECLKSDTVKLFENSPINQQPLILIEDSNTYSVGGHSIDIQIESEDQCVPVVANPTNESPKKQEQSEEPMDIDESIPANVTIDDFSDKSNTSKENLEMPEKRKSSVSEKDKSINKSKRKSSITIQRTSETSMTEEKNDSINKSKKDSSISSKLNPLTSAQEKLNNSSKEKSNRSSSFSQVALEIEGKESRKSFDKSQRKSSISITDENNESSNKSKRTSSVSLDNSLNQNTNESRKTLDKSQRKTSTSVGEQNNEELSEGSKKSKRKSSISLNNSNANQNGNKSRKSSMSIGEDNAEKLNESSNKSKIKSSVSLIDESNDTKSSNKSKISSSVSQTDAPNLEKSGNENKSTLVISQLKDVSTNDTNTAVSPNVTNNELSKSLNGPDVKNNLMDKKNLSLNYLTSTPIQQKPLQKFTMQINTSNISPALDNKNNTSEKLSKKKSPKESDFSDETDEEIKFKNKTERLVVQKKIARAPSSSESSDEESDTESKFPIKKAVKQSPNKKVPALESSDEESEQDKNTPNNQSKANPKVEAKKVKPNKKPASDSSDTDDSDEEVSKDRSKLIDEEASEASDDYESGDSQNEEDRRYEAENEIVDKGETIESDAEFSNDSDYEKDSFIVSSDAEDNEILSGTGDDLSLSDNELTMSAKSKKKFNERKLKQQKNASREMYEARHKKDESANISKSETGKSKKSKRQRLESSTIESENENTQPKKSNRLRIDSSQDSSIVKSDADESIGVKKKKSRRLSESVHEITSNEKEITIFNQSTTEKSDPLSVVVKQEPKTPLKQFDMSTVAINDNIEEVQVDSNASILRQNESMDPLQAAMVTDDVDDSSSSDNMEIIENYDSVLNNLTMQSKKIKTVDTSLNLNKKSKDSKDPVIDQLNLTQPKKSKKNKNKYVEDSKPTEQVKPAKESKSVKHDEDSSDSIDMKLLFPEDSNDSEINASQFKQKVIEEPVEDFIPLKKSEALMNIPRNMDTSTSELNVSRKKNKKRKSSLSAPEETTNTDNIEEPEDIGIKIIIDTTGTRQELEESMAQTSSSKKKKNKKNKSLMEDSKDVESADGIDCTDGVPHTPVEISFTSEKKRKKNKNKSFDASVTNVENSFSVTPNENTDTIVDDMHANISIKSDKKMKKNKHGVSQNIEPEVVTTSSAKKKSKTSISLEDVEPEAQSAKPAEIPAETSINSEKKKRKKKNKNKQNLESSQTIVDNTGEESDDAPTEISFKREKQSDATDTVTDEALASSGTKKHKKNKKKKKNNNVPQSLEISDDNVRTIEQDGDLSLKRKRKASDETKVVAIIPMTASNEKKKRKVQLDDECIAAYNDTEQNSRDEGGSKKSKKNKKSKSHDNVVEDEVLQQNPKKRKNRDDDSEEKVHKVSKQNYFDKIHIPKIPESVIKQLAEKPQNQASEKAQNKMANKKNKKATAAIATMPFVVEEAERRKNKPSNYLEQSVYLNDSPVKTKQKCSKDKPKVLPFIPTALTSDSGYTSKFNINVLPGETQFVAQASNVENFKESFLGSQRIKKLGTFERCKIHRSHKISKF